VVSSVHAVGRPALPDLCGRVFIAAAMPVTSERHVPLARSESCETVQGGHEDAVSAGLEGDTSSWRLQRLPLRRVGALCVAVVLGAIAVLRGTSASPRLATIRGYSPSSLFAEERGLDDDCKACDDEYSKGSGVIADPTMLGGAMTFEDVQKALHSQCPEHCRKTMNDDSGRFAGFDGIDGEDDWGTVGGRLDDVDLLADDGTPCHTSAAGEMCYDLVTYTVRKLLTNSDFYPGLTPESSQAEVQGRLHLDRPGICHRPCQEGEEDGHTSEKGKKTRADEGDGEGDDSECKVAEPGDDCFEVIIWVLTQGVFQHPKWFRGLNQASSMVDVQRHLHNNPEKGMPPSCPEPCEEKCHDAVEGEPCFGSVTWAMEEGIKNHSEWFSGLSVASTFPEVQLNIHSNLNATVHCPKPCNACHTAVDGERCYSAVVWVMEEGIEKHPESFRGLNRFSSFQEVQDHLHRNKSEAKSHCVKPCPVAQEGESNAPSRLLLDSPGSTGQRTGPPPRFYGSPLVGIRG